MVQLQVAPQQREVFLGNQLKLAVACLAKQLNQLQELQIYLVVLELPNLLLFLVGLLHLGLQLLQQAKLHLVWDSSRPHLLFLVSARHQLLIHLLALVSSLQQVQHLLLERLRLQPQEDLVDSVVAAPLVLLNSQQLGLAQLLEHLSNNQLELHQPLELSSQQLELLQLLGLEHPHLDLDSNQ